MHRAEPKIASLITKFKKSEIQDVFRTSYYVCRRLELDIKASNRKNYKISRILIIIPKKIGSAPVRNLMRRRIKSIFYEEKLYQSFYNFIFFCKPNIVNLSYSELKNIILTCCKK